MHFGPWISIPDALKEAPESAGIVQLRAPAIFTYPRGQSAMVYYASSASSELLSTFMARYGREMLLHAETHGASWVRYGETAQPERELSRLLRGFEQRFGSLPIGNVAEGRRTSRES